MEILDGQVLGEERFITFIYFPSGNCNKFSQSAFYSRKKREAEVCCLTPEWL